MQLKDIINHYGETEHEPTVQVWHHKDYGSVVARLRFMDSREPDVVFDSYNAQNVRVDKDNGNLAYALKSLGIQGTIFDLDW